MTAKILSFIFNKIYQPSVKLNNGNEIYYTRSGVGVNFDKDLEESSIFRFAVRDQKLSNNINKNTKNIVDYKTDDKKARVKNIAFSFCPLCGTNLEN